MQILMFWFWCSHAVPNMCPSNVKNKFDWLNKCRVLILNILISPVSQLLNAMKYSYSFQTLAAAAEFLSIIYRCWIFACYLWGIWMDSGISAWGVENLTSLVGERNATRFCWWQMAIGFSPAVQTQLIIYCTRQRREEKCGSLVRPSCFTTLMTDRHSFFDFIHTMY